MPRPSGIENTTRSGISFGLCGNRTLPSVRNCIAFPISAVVIYRILDEAIGTAEESSTTQDKTPSLLDHPAQYQSWTCRTYRSDSGFTPHSQLHSQTQMQLQVPAAAMIGSRLPPITNDSRFAAEPWYFLRY